MKDFNLNIDPNLNKEQVLLYHPPAEFVLDSKENEQLSIMPIPYKIEDINLTKHIGDTSTYPQKNELIKSLTFIQHRLINGFNQQLGNLSENEKQIILTKLSEGITFCSEGFHNRVQEIILSWSRPKNILQLLHQARESLVVQAAAASSNEVHATNRFFTIAHVYGFGVRPRYAKDIYHGSLNVDTIVDRLKNAFEKRLTAFSVVQMIADTLHSALADCYHDYDAKGYDKGDYDAILSRLNQLLTIDNENLNLKLDDCFLIEEKEEDGIPLQRYVAINWHTINQTIFKQLKNYGIYVSNVLEPQNIIDLAHYLQLYPFDPSTTENNTKSLGYAKKLINSPSAFKTLWTHLSTQQKQAFFDALIEYLPTIINNGKDFGDISASLDKAQRTVLCNTCIPFFPKIMKTSRDFFDGLQNLNDQQRIIVSNACLSLLPEFVKCFSDFEKLISYLPYEQRSVIANALVSFLPNTVENISHFKSIFVYLGDKEKTAFCIAFEPFFSRIVKNAWDINDLFLLLSIEQLPTTYNASASFFPRIIKDISDLRVVIQSLYGEKIEAVCRAWAPFLSLIIKEMPTFKELCQNLRPHQIAAVCVGATAFLFTLIKDSKDFVELLADLDNYRRADVLQAFRPYLAHIVKSIGDFKTLIKPLDETERDIVCGASAPYLPFIVRDLDNFQNLAKCLSRTQVGIIYTANASFLPYIIKSVPDLITFLQCFDEGKQPCIHRVLTTRLRTIIKSAKDFDDYTTYCENRLDYKKKIEILKMFKEEAWFKPFLLAHISGRKAFQLFFNERAPEAIILQESFYEFFQKSLAAYALLKAQEQKAPTKKAAYYSKPMWNYLKDLANAFFNKEDIDKIHRRQPLTMQSFFACKSKHHKTPLYPGDLTLSMPTFLKKK